jgi:methenyltetrahydrofolate cyclohydrolase
MPLPDGLQAFANDVAAATPAPAGGAVAAVTLALAAALMAMVARIGERREPGSLASVAARFDSIRLRLLAVAEEDAQAYSAVLEARRTPGSDVGREARIARAWERAAAAPAEVVKLGEETLVLAAEAAAAFPASAAADAAMAARIATAAVAGSLHNLRLNVAAAGQPDELRAVLETAEGRSRRAEEAASAVLRSTGG